MLLRWDLPWDSRRRGEVLTHRAPPGAPRKTLQPQCGDPRNCPVGVRPMVPPPWQGPPAWDLGESAAGSHQTCFGLFTQGHRHSRSAGERVITQLLSPPPRWVEHGLPCHPRVFPPPAGPHPAHFVMLLLLPPLVPPLLPPAFLAFFSWAWRARASSSPPRPLCFSDFFFFLFSFLSRFFLGLETGPCDRAASCSCTARSWGETHQ